MSAARLSRVRVGRWGTLLARLLQAGLKLGIALTLASCAEPITGLPGFGGAGSDAHIAPYARVPYQPFSPYMPLPPYIA